jgi:hypothetical protein
MTIHQLIYMSQPFGFDDAMLNGILASSRRCNTRDGLTGALVCRADIYLQLLEGDEAAVENAYIRIAGDNRHLGVERLCSGAAEERMFPDWAMLDDPARSWLWNADEVADGAVQRASPAQVREVFERIKSEIA